MAIVQQLVDKAPINNPTFTGIVTTPNIVGTSTLSITSNTTNTLTIDSGTTGAVNIGNNANAKIITIGNNTGATGVNITTGTGNLIITSPLATISGDLTVTGGDIKTGAATISTLFGDTTTGNITIAGGLTTGTFTIGATGSTGAVSLFPSTGSQAITLGGATTGTITIGGGANTINVGSTGANTINIGSSSSAAINLPTAKTKIGQTTLVQGGAVSITLPSTAGTLYVSGGTDISIGDGGTGTSTAPVAGGIIYGASTSAYGSTAVGTQNQVLISNGASTPSWATLDMSYLPSSNFKKSVKAASTANVAIATGGLLTIDGVTLTVGDRILLKNQTTATENGIYVAATGAWTRAADADTIIKLANSLIAVDQGAANGGCLFDNDNKSTDTLGTTAIVFNSIADNGKRLDYFASTTSAQLATIISDETGSGSLVFANSPTFTGTPLSTTAAVDTNTTQIATTAYVINQGYAKASTIGNGTLTMNVSGTGLSGSATFTANQSGGSTFTVASNATNNNTASTIVARDSSGNFSAGTISATLNGNASTATSLTGGSAGTLPYQSANNTTNMLAAGTQNQFLKSNGASAPSWQTLDMSYLPESTFKKSVKVASTANIAIATGGLLTVDGVTLTAGDRVLLKNQTAPAENGIYIVATGAWTRAADADTITKLSSALVAVDSGTTNGGLLFDNDLKTTGTLGSTAITWNIEADNGKKLNFFATTTSAELASIISDETGSGALVFGTSPTIVTPNITTSINDVNANKIISITPVASAVNQVNITNSVAGSAPIISPAGNDTNISLNLTGKGTGVVTAPTAAVDTNTTQIATTAFVLSQASITTPLANGKASVGTATKFAREDHIHPNDGALIIQNLTADPASPAVGQIWLRTDLVV